MIRLFALLLVVLLIDLSSGKKISQTTGKLIKATIDIKDNLANVDLLEEEQGIAPGQACVFYSKNDLGYKVLGGGWIKN